MASPCGEDRLRRWVSRALGGTCEVASVVAVAARVSLFCDCARFADFLDDHEGWLSLHNSSDVVSGDLVARGTQEQLQAPPALLVLSDGEPQHQQALPAAALAHKR